MLKANLDYNSKNPKDKFNFGVAINIGKI